jgi:predicted transglutaminase-like cysteine proteinase
MRYCPQCGTEVKDGDTFCSKCGALVSGSDQGQPAPEQRPRAIPAQRPNWIPALVVAVMIVLASFAGIIALSNLSNTNASDITVDYKWNYDGKSYEISETISRSDYNKALSSTIDRSGTISSNMYIHSLDGKSSTVFGVNDYIVVDSNITGLQEKLKAKYTNAYGSDSSTSGMDYANFITAFVQVCFGYVTDSIQYGSEEYWAYPIQTLVNGKGDCEDTSILETALLMAAGYSACIFLLPSHAMSGVKSIGEAQVGSNTDNFKYQIVKQEFYTIETTTDSFTPVGACSVDRCNCYFHAYSYSEYKTEYYSS